MNTTATNPEPQFLFPTSRQFPFDEVCEQIVRALKERSWSVPGIDVEFDVYGRGDARYRMVRSIKGEDFRLYFARTQNSMGRWNDTAAVSEIGVPRRMIRVYDDESGPTFYVHARKGHWEEDKLRFFDNAKVNSKLNGQNRWYLQYKGACTCGSTGGASFSAVEFLTAFVGGSRSEQPALSHTHQGRRSPLLVHDNNLGREHKPKRRQTPAYRTDDVFAHFADWLRGNVLMRILDVPPTAPEDYLSTATYFREELSPLTQQHAAVIGPIFTFGELRDGHRIQKGQQNPTTLEPSDRFGLSGDGYRLVPLGIRHDGTFPKVAYDGFLWCGLGRVADSTPIRSLDVPGHFHWERKNLVIRLNLRWIDGVYIADQAAMERRREELFEAIKPRDRLTDSELNSTYAPRAATLMPLRAYVVMVTEDQSTAFTQPVILINRDLGLDEVELVSGTGLRHLLQIKRYSPEARQLLEEVISAQNGYFRGGYTSDGDERIRDAIGRLSNYILANGTLHAVIEEASNESPLGRGQTYPGTVRWLMEKAYELRLIGLI